MVIPVPGVTSGKGPMGLKRTTGQSKWSARKAEVVMIVTRRSTFFPDSRNALTCSGIASG